LFKVLLQIKDRLGRSWRDVARRLNIRECEIDAIQSKYPYDLKEQSNEVKLYIYNKSLNIVIYSIYRKNLIDYMKI